MVLAPGAGKEGNLTVGSDNAVLGVRSVGVPNSWNSEDVMHLQDDAPSTLLNYKQWSIPIELTLDHADAGQAEIFGAFDSGTSLAFKAYVDNTHYWTANAYVTKWDEKIDAKGINTVSVELKPYLGEALTYS